jgi:hypothetical protein
LLRERGYTLSGHPVLHVSSARRRWLETQSRAATAVQRVQRHGVPMFAGELLTRRLGLRRWHRSIRRRMDQTTDANLR